ncbi:MAG: leucine-rich repeat protein, partial [Lachnospiraceae bacterium]|nr:leucine-rich repeat protein [Lachnospiraceae bacterium]
MEYSGKQRAKRPVAFLLMLLAALILSGVTVMAGEEEISSQGAPGYNDYIYTTLDYEIVDTDYLVVDEEEGFVYPYRNKYVLTWYLNDQGELTLTSIIGEDVTGEFRIPAAVQFQRSEEYDPSNIFDTFVEEGTSYPVTAINNLDHGKFSTLVIPDSVKTIASCAYCDNLTKLTLPGGVEIKETQCFEGCPALEEVTLGSGIKHIPNQTFRDCKALKKVTLPDTLESIGDQVFSNDISLTTINENNVLPASLKSIGEDTFARCALTQITMPANYDADHFSNPFGGDHYLNCQTLEEIKVAEGGNTTYFAVDGVLYYKDDNNVTRLAAYPAGKKDETFTVSANTIVCRSAFSDNTYLKEVTFEDGVVLEPWAFTSRETAEAKGLAIGGNSLAYEEGFDNVIPLKKLIFKGSAKIEYSCFENCESLTDIVFESDKLIDFANNSFVQCDALTTFTYPRNFTLSSTPYDEPDTGFMGRRLGLFDACQNLAT